MNDLFHNIGYKAKVTLAPSAARFLMNKTKDSFTTLKLTFKILING